MDGKQLLLHSLRSERRLTRETVAAMAEGEMGYQPTPEQMAFGAQALHILSAYATLIDGISGKGWNWEQGIGLERYPTREAILACYDAETERLMRFLEAMEPERFAEVVETGWGARESIAQLLIGWLCHETHHRGQMVTYLRLKGGTPPRY